MEVRRGICTDRRGVFARTLYSTKYNEAYVEALMPNRKTKGETNKTGRSASPHTLTSITEPFVEVCNSLVDSVLCKSWT